MRRVSPLHGLIGCGLIALFTSSCSPKDPGTETGSRSTVDSVENGANSANGAVAVTTESDEARALYARGRALAEQLRQHDAGKLFQEAIAKDSNFALAHYDFALVSPTTRGFRAHLDRAVALSSHASEGERLMIQSLKSGADGDTKQQLAYAEELVAKYPRDARAQTLLANAYAGRQDFDKAVGQLNKAIAASPDYAPAYNLLGYSYMPQGKYAEAEQAFKTYIELVPNDPNPYDSYAEMLMRTGRFEESIVQYRKALSLEPHFSNSYLGIASNLVFQGKHDAAAAEAQKLHDAARDDGDRRQALISRTLTFVDQGQTAKAVQESEKLYALDARIGDTAAMSLDAIQTGDILLGAGRPDEAATRYRQSLALVQGSSLSTEVKENATLADRYNVARVALAKGDLPAAQAAAAEYLKGAEVTNDVGRIRLGHELAGSIALQEKHFDQAGAELAQADQQDPYILYETALAYQGQGDAAKARELAGRAANMNTFPTVRSAQIRAKAIKMQ